MLFISILLSVWFVIWLMHAVFVKDVMHLFVSWMEMFSEDEDEDIDPLLEKSEGKGVYHLSCNECNYLWWSIEPNVKYCPNCGHKMELKKEN